MDREAVLAKGKPGVGRLDAPIRRLSALAYSGRLQAARTMSQRAVDMARQAAQKERAACYEAGAALREAFSGMRPRQGVARWRHSSFQGPGCRVRCGICFGSRGRFFRGRKHSPTIWRQRFPEDTAVRFNYVCQRFAHLSP